MSYEEIFEKVSDVFLLVFGKDTVITPDTTASDIAGWDSLNHVRLVRELEKAFNTEFDLFEVFELTGVNAIVGHLQKTEGV